ncbi:MAG: Gfo/Idh/MocA family oxidoreductase [Planctomycetes bacterium]|nr:Gfo/Idh/MocA family oxidoreductase [Planctomycetota bacterium]MBU1518965.1 Gfo/Idh/MocA family oxidoreductase [Planctomycetota bacterium]MBU2457464.1 Gfo/Idh/MocA family oxidoreductase [Planctomycetota bacterium]
MSIGKLKTACLGIGTRTSSLLDIACSTELYEIISVADSNITNASQAAQKYNCTAFDDYRQFILQNQPDVLIVAEPLYKCADFVRIALNKQCHILKLVPTAPNFEQAAELISLAEKNNVKYVTAIPSRFAPGFERLTDYLQTIDRKQYYFINICASFGGNFFQPIASYAQADRKLSGGGVLLHDCFEMISLVVENFSLPGQIYALITNQSPDKKAKQYLGEDTVTASLVFNGLIGTFLAAKQTGSSTAAPIRIYGAENNIVATPNRLAVYDNNDSLIAEHKYPLNSEKCITEMFIDFGRALLEPDKYKLRSSSRLDLATMAFIEAAYLSTRTSMPESPSRFLEIAEKEKSPFA